MKNKTGKFGNSKARKRSGVLDLSFVVFAGAVQLFGVFAMAQTPPRLTQVDERIRVLPATPHGYKLQEKIAAAREMCNNQAGLDLLFRRNTCTQNQILEIVRMTEKLVEASYKAWTDYRQLICVLAYPPKIMTLGPLNMYLLRSRVFCRGICTDRTRCQPDTPSENLASPPIYFSAAHRGSLPLFNDDFTPAAVDLNDPTFTWTLLTNRTRWHVAIYAALHLAGFGRGDYLYSEIITYTWMKLSFDNRRISPAYLP